MVSPLRVRPDILQIEPRRFELLPGVEPCLVEVVRRFRVRAFAEHQYGFGFHLGAGPAGHGLSRSSLNGSSPPDWTRSSRLISPQGTFHVPKSFLRSDTIRSSVPTGSCWVSRSCFQNQMSNPTLAQSSKLNLSLFQRMRRENGRARCRLRPRCTSDIPTGPDCLQTWRRTEWNCSSAGSPISDSTPAATRQWNETSAILFPASSAYMASNVGTASCAMAARNSPRMRLGHLAPFSDLAGLLEAREFHVQGLAIPSGDHWTMVRV